MQVGLSIVLQLHRVLGRTRGIPDSAWTLSLYRVTEATPKIDCIYNLQSNIPKETCFIRLAWGFHFQGTSTPRQSQDMRRCDLLGLMYLWWMDYSKQHFIMS